MSRVKHNATHQFAAGLNNAPENHPAALHELPISSPIFQGWKLYYEPLNIGAAYADDAYWEITSVVSGTLGAGDSNSIVMDAGAATDNSGYELRHDIATIQTAGATKRYYFETVVKLTATTMASNEWFVGWTNDEKSTNAGGAAWDFEDGFGFGQLAAGTPVFVTNSSDSEQSIAMSGALTTATYRKYACYFDGTNYNLYEDDVLITTSVASPVPVADVPIGCNIDFKTAESVQNTLNVKYNLFALEI